MRRSWLALVCLLPLGCATELGPASGACADGYCDVAEMGALCEATVRGTGSVQVEEVYLPHVLACENPAGGPAALRAQAIAARSYLYSIIGTNGTIGDGQTDQVFTCTDPSTGKRKQPRQEHYDAVAETAGQVLSHDGVLITTFYVAGALQSGPTCTGGTSDPTGTERLVTYNQGKTGSQVVESAQGSSGNPANRGTMSQNGANCLADQGKSTLEILQFYYGADAEITQTVGECIGNVAQVTAGDIGNACSSDSDCDATCETWYLPTVNQTFGMCTAECSGFCPDGSACVAMGSGRHVCAPTPSADNAYCGNIPGTTPRVLEGVGGTGWESVCATPMVGTKCNANGQKGECQDIGISACSSGVLEQGVCPGGAEIQCCLI